MVLRVIFLFFVIVFGMNRFCLFAEHYQRLTMERQNDLYVFAMCNQLDYKKIGRHANLCSDLERRLKHSVIFETTKTVIDDTLYREVSVTGLLYGCLLLLVSIMIGNVYNKYVRIVDYNLPTIQQKLKKN